MKAQTRFGTHDLFAAFTVLCLCGVAVVPLLRSASPCTHDGGLHYFRTAALKHAVKSGILYTRWLPELAFGYGFPFFNYRAPLSYYLGLSFHIVGVPLPLALNMLYALSTLGSALGAYLLARDLFGPWPAVLAGVTYAYAPYQFLDALVRGNAPETVALALLPFVLWTFRRLALRGGRWWFLLAVASLTGLYLGHNISSLLFTPFLLAYLALLWVSHPRLGSWKRTSAALALALGLTAFFWLPALAEKGYVQLYLTGATRNNDFHHNFVTLGEILAPPSAVDTSLMNPPLEVRLGIVPVVLAIAGLVLGLISSRSKRSGETSVTLLEDRNGRGKNVGEQRAKERRMSLLLFAVAAALFTFMSTSVSIWLWEHVPLLSFVQFPWRFVGRASLPVALLAGAAVLPLENAGAASRSLPFRLGRHVPDLVPFFLVIAVILTALPSASPPRGYCPMKPYPSVQDVHRYERRSGLVGVDPVGAYFPIWVQQRPQESSLEAQYLDAGPVARFDRSVLPEGAQILESGYDANRARILLESPEAFRGRYLSFYFPGWRVSVDGEPIEVTPSDPEGLITFDVPPGRRTVTVRFGETPLRLGADAISLLALAALVISTALCPPSSSCSSRKSHQSEIGYARVAGLLLTAGILLILRLFVVDQMPTLFRHARLRSDGTLPGVEHPRHQPFADGLTLIGFDQSAKQMPGDSILRVDLYWTVRQQPSRRYQTVVHLVGPDGLRWSPGDSLRPTDFQDPPPTSTWSPGHYALDSHEIESLPGTPPGRYDIVLTVFDQETLAPLSVLNERGQPASPELTVGQLELRAPRDPADPSRLGIQQAIDRRLGPLTLLGVSFDRREAVPGDPVWLTTFWRADDQPEKDLKLHLGLLTSQGISVTRYTRSAVASWFPTSAWQPGDVWRGQHVLYLPGDLATGTYTWTLSLAPQRTPPVSLSALLIGAPERAFAVPPLEIEAGARLDGFATLLGANVAPSTSNLRSGSALTVTLVWRAEAQTNVSYRVFLHLVGANGSVIAQSDGIPAGWTRPTTGWIGGEIIRDARPLIIPTDASPGTYTLYAGLYTPEGGRLSTSDGRDAIRVTALTIEK